MYLTTFKNYNLTKICAHANTSTAIDKYTACSRILFQPDVSWENKEGVVGTCEGVNLHTRQSVHTYKHTCITYSNNT